MPRIEDLDEGVPEATDYLVFLDRDDLSDPAFEEGRPKRVEVADLPTTPPPADEWVPSAAGVENVASVTGLHGHYQEQGPIFVGSALCALTPSSVGTCVIELTPPSGTVASGYGTVAVFGTVAGGGVVGEGGKLSLSVVVTSTDPTLILAMFTYKRA